MAQVSETGDSTCGPSSTLNLERAASKKYVLISAGEVVRLRQRSPDRGARRIEAGNCIGIACIEGLPPAFQNGGSLVHGSKLRRRLRLSKTSPRARANWLYHEPTSQYPSGYTERLSERDAWPRLQMPALRQRQAICGIPQPAAEL